MLIMPEVSGSQIDCHSRGSRAVIDSGSKHDLAPRGLATNGGQQFVRVEHVHVNDGGQAVIGNVKKQDAQG